MRDRGRGRKSENHMRRGVVHLKSSSSLWPGFKLRNKSFILIIENIKSTRVKIHLLFFQLYFWTACFFPSSQLFNCQQFTSFAKLFSRLTLSKNSPAVVPKSNKGSKKQVTRQSIIFSFVELFRLGWGTKLTSRTCKWGKLRISFCGATVCSLCWWRAKIFLKDFSSQNSRERAKKMKMVFF